MALILQKTDKLEFHTDLRALIAPIKSEFASCNWLLTNQDYMVLDYKEKGLIEKLDHESPKIQFTGTELLKIVETRSIQFIWGVFCGIKGQIPELAQDQLPFADCNPNVWSEPDTFFLQESEIEIICFDGTSTILKFRNKEVEEKFRVHFEEAKILVQ
ncbi:MAG: hypothetical protein H7Y13_16760 [Sphingobacteriaceae bacterium]|nr:hypothetical protein [Sphingobacteriaceae bacterium]